MRDVIEGLGVLLGDDTCIPYAEGPSSSLMHVYTHIQSQKWSAPLRTQRHAQSFPGLTLSQGQVLPVSPAQSNYLPPIIRAPNITFPKNPLFFT